jgi:hypothetical protein
VGDSIDWNRQGRGSQPVKEFVVNRWRILAVLTVFTAGAFFGAAVPVLSQSAGSKVTNLLTVALSPDFTPDREVLIDLVEIPPNQKLAGTGTPEKNFTTTWRVIPSLNGVMPHP